MHVRTVAAGLLRAGRARRARGRREELSCSDSARARRAPAGTASTRTASHFIGLVNVVNLKAGGLGTLGTDQLEWLEKDVKPLKSSTPIVVFAHIPLWSVYPEWGWGTDDSAQALSYLKRFGSVSVLNGHIHQVMQKVEGTRHVPHGHVDRLPATRARHGAVAGTDEGGRRSAAQGARARRACRFTP